MPKKMKVCKNDFTKINRNLDSEHTKILKTMDKLYEMCDMHWQTENRMYKEGLKQMPKGHKNTSIEWKEHTAHHKAFLKKINLLKKEIIEHINTDDVRDFHWANLVEFKMT
jgi:hypothetical protein|tara:strand:- start:259 stop:591 length:333 start_codon:yes stop_codon:yes gene_type:complete